MKAQEPGNRGVTWGTAEGLLDKKGWDSSVSHSPIHRDPSMKLPSLPMRLLTKFGATFPLPSVFHGTRARDAFRPPSGASREVQTSHGFAIGSGGRCKGRKKASSEIGIYPCYSFDSTRVLCLCPACTRVCTARDHTFAIPGFGPSRDYLCREKRLRVVGSCQNTPMLSWHQMGYQMLPVTPKVALGPEQQHLAPFAQARMAALPYLSASAKLQARALLHPIEV